jgi:colanic acid biosynthesis glycosyl transferase WcaI
VKVILQSLNYSPELTGIGKYNGEMCEELSRRGIDITAIVAPPYYPDWKVAEGFKKYWYSTQIINNVTVLRCPLYVPKSVTTIKRLIHLISFSMSSTFRLFSKLFDKPDIIIVVQPTLFCAPFVLLYSKITGAKSILHVQDFEVDALFGLGMMSNGRLAKLAFTIESWLSKRFDAVSTISFSMLEKAKYKGVDENKLVYFPNWSDVSFVTPETSGDDLKKQWGFSDSDRILLYAGNIGNKQGLDSLIQSAQHFCDDNTVKFLIVGAGTYLDTLKAIAASLELNNIFFKPLVPLALLPQLLALADIHLVIQRKGAADAVLPSKLTNILSAGGHAIVTAEPHTELSKIAEEHTGIYDVIEPESVPDLTRAIKTKLKTQTRTHNTIARQFAINNLDKHKIIDKFTQELNTIIKK